MAAHSLVIVESPAKARTIAGYLGKDYIVESSIGHIRDLAKNANQVPPSMKKEPWAYLGVDIYHGFKPYYVVDDDKTDHIKKLKGLLSDAKELFLATDEDREGESIAWHLLEVLKPKVPVKRMVFHEITKPAIKHAIEHPRSVDRQLVDAQEARRILDRLYGYDVSKVLWMKVMAGLSAGRVQSVATRIIVDREKQRMAFVRASYWDLEASMDAEGSKFGAALHAVQGQRVASSKDFDDSGRIVKPGILLLNEARARALAGGLQGRTAQVTSVERKPQKRSPAAPFMTSTLQQEASRKLRFSAKRTMDAAQTLYASGFITYMRTDSTQLSTAAIQSSRSHIRQMYGEEYLPKEPRVYAKKVKNAQEAHEAIRPAGETFRHPDEVAREVGPDEAKLYETVWMRTIASQMNDALGESVQVRMTAKTAANEDVELSANGYTILFPGFLRAYVEGSDDPAAELEGRERPLPRLQEGQILKIAEVEAKGHETQPPARFTEASLVQKLEELGVGRPSTYASTIDTITQKRGYVWKKGSALVPSFKAFAVVQLMEKHFDALVDYAFTAKMEDDLDEIAAGRTDSTPWLERFYFGEKGPAASKTGRPSAKKDDKDEPAENRPETKGIQTLGLQSMVSDQMEKIDARQINSIVLGRDAEDREIVIRVGRFGPYLSRGDSTASIPNDLAPDELTIAKAEELLAAPSGDRLLGNHPDTGEPIYVKSGRFGSYVQQGELPPQKPKGKGKAKSKEKDKVEDKPKTASLLRTMDSRTLTLEEALKVLSLPRVVGTDPETGSPITAQIGQYGAYVKRQTAEGRADSRSLANEEQAFTVTLDEALALFAQKKVRGARSAPLPLKTFPEDIVSNKPINVFQGKFGLYVTDGETNASLQSDDSLERLSHDRAMALLQQRRDRGQTDPGAKKSWKGGKGKGGFKRSFTKKAAAPKAEAAPKAAAPKKAAPKKAAPKKKKD